jgi:hypothetical protein
LERPECVSKRILTDDRRPRVVELKLPQLIGCVLSLRALNTRRDRCKTC